MYRVLTGLIVLAAMGATVAVHAQRVEPRVDRVDYDLEVLVAPTTLSEAEQEGRRLFVQRCAFCHERRGLINVDADRIARLGETRVRESIKQGLERQMPGFQYTLDDAQVGQIISFLKTVTSD